MRGHIKKRKNSYSIVLSLGRDPVTKQRKQQWITVHGTKRDAERKLAELLHQLDTGTFIKPGKTTLGEFLLRWLEEYAKPNLVPKTVEGYESIIRQHLIPKLGNIALTQLKPEHLQRYYSELLSGGRCDGKGGLSTRSVRYHHVTLHCALRNAMKWGLISRNPADAVDLPHSQRPEMHIMDENDIQKLLRAAKDTPYYALFYLALFTGMRRSELLALRWQDIDLLLCQAYITRSIHQLNDGRLVFQNPKTAKGRRMVSLPPSAVSVLREHKDKQKTTNLILGKPSDDSDLVFCQLDGKPLIPDTVSHAWVKLAKRIGCEHVRLHDARHSHASLLLKQGVHPKIVQERLGHASIQITLDTYSHVAPGLQEAAAARFDDIINPTREKEAVCKIG